MPRRRGRAELLALSLVIMCVMCGCGSDSSAASPSSQTEQSSPRPRGPIFVVDSRGKRVGQFFPPDLVDLEINGLWFQLSMNKNGFIPPFSGFLYQTQDCSGTPYAGDGGPADLTSFLSSADGVADSVIYYQGSSAQPISCKDIVFGSSSTIDADGTMVCKAIAESTNSCPEGGNEVFGPVSTLDISFLRLVPPFHLQQEAQ
jgi:hypothetical protein